MEDHTAFFLIITLFATATWHTQGGESAIVRSQHDYIKAFKEMLQNSGINKVRDARSTDRAEGGREQHLCDSNPCGWSVYKKFTREFDTYVQNICQCADDSYKCVHVEDDLSINAYVYRCRQNTTATDTVAPTGDTN